MFSNIFQLFMFWFYFLYNAYGLCSVIPKREEVHELSSDIENNVWEESGFFEGDIFLGSKRNGMLNETYYWPDSLIPFQIDENDFNETQVNIILGAMEEYKKRTCIRFRAFQKNDENWIVFKGNNTGCWSSVGMQKGQQVVNLNTPRCVTHGVVLHEILHALGFFHQQSSTNRDDFVKINWENILEGKESNFNKYNTTYITSFGVDYDYGSIMHYSGKAFSKNGDPTIEPLMNGVSLGQRKELSESDTLKLNKMYESSCNH
ncbi:hypothetical protein ACFFRR_000908 [Megaselia abdita]